MSGGLFVGVEKYLIGGITDATKGLMMSYSSIYAYGRHDVGHHEDGDHPVLCG